MRVNNYLPSMNCYYRKSVFEIVFLFFFAELYYLSTDFQNLCSTIKVKLGTIFCKENIIPTVILNSVYLRKTSIRDLKTHINILLQFTWVIRRNFVYGAWCLLFKTRINGSLLSNSIKAITFCLFILSIPWLRVFFVCVFFVFLKLFFCLCFLITK